MRNALKFLVGLVLFAICTVFSMAVCGFLGLLFGGWISPPDADVCSGYGIPCALLAALLGGGIGASGGAKLSKSVGITLPGDRQARALRRATSAAIRVFRQVYKETRQDYA